MLVQFRPQCNTTKIYSSLQFIYADKNILFISFFNKLFRLGLIPDKQHVYRSDVESLLVILLTPSIKLETVLTRLILGCAMVAKDAIFCPFRL